MKMRQLLICAILICTFSNGAEVPPELQSLQEQRTREIAKIDTIYKRQLETLKRKYTKAGNLEAANQVAAVLSKLELEDSFKVEGAWVWKGLDAIGPNELVLRPNGVATFTYWHGNGKWSEDKPGVLRITSDAGRIFEFTIRDGIGNGVHPLNGRPISIVKTKDKQDAP